MAPHSEDSILKAAGVPTQKEMQEGFEEDPALAEEAIENDSNRNKFMGPWVLKATYQTVKKGYTR